jgi:glycosyltransferase involved in cell wall biosynthesis
MAKPRVALLFGNTVEHNSRAMRMAASLVEAGSEVTLVARAGPGLPDRESRHGYRVVRLPAPRGPRWLPAPPLPGPRSASGPGSPSGVRGALREGPGRLAQAFRFLFLARAWADVIEHAVDPADAWQADGLVMLPVALELRRRHGGRAIYDSLEIHVESGSFARLPGPWKRLLARRERTWAQDADAVITVSRAYADVIGPRLGVDPVVVMNCPRRPPEAPVDPAAAPSAGSARLAVPAASPAFTRRRRFHDLLGLPAETAIVLYHGYVFPHRGIERLFEAIALVARAHLVVMGFGPRFDDYVTRAAALPHADRVHVVPGVPPEDLLGWVASADVAAMPIEGNTLNHRLTTPNKLFEAMSAGVPLVASDLPGMAAIVRETGAGVLCDPDDPADIAGKISSILEAAVVERQAYRERALAAARSRYNWERQAEEYLAVYRRLGVIPGADAKPA